MDPLEKMMKALESAKNNNFSREVILSHVSRLESCLASLEKKGIVILDRHSLRYKKINGKEYYLIFYHTVTNRVYLWDCYNNFSLLENLNNSEKQQIITQTILRENIHTQ